MVDIRLSKVGNSIDEIVIDSNKVSLEDEVNEELDRLGQGGRWVW